MYRASPEKTILRLLAEAVDAAEGILRDSFIGTPLQGVTRAQVALFGVLERSGPATVGDLARALGITPQAMGESVRRLQRDGLVDVATDPRDSRARLVSISPLGQDILRAVTRELGHLEHLLAVRLGTDRLAELRASLAVIPAIREARKGSRADPARSPASAT